MTGLNVATLGGAEDIRSGIRERDPFRLVLGVTDAVIGSYREGDIRILGQNSVDEISSRNRRYLNEERSHQGINQRIPNHPDSLAVHGSGDIGSVAFLGGRHHSNPRISGPWQANLVGGGAKQPAQELNQLDCRGARRL